MFFTLFTSSGPCLWPSFREVRGGRGGRDSGVGCGRLGTGQGRVIVFIPRPTADIQAWYLTLSWGACSPAHVSLPCTLASHLRWCGHISHNVCCCCCCCCCCFQAASDESLELRLVPKGYVDPAFNLPYGARLVIGNLSHRWAFGCVRRPATGAIVSCAHSHCSNVTVRTHEIQRLLSHARSPSGPVGIRFAGSGGS